MSYSDREYLLAWFWRDAVLVQETYQELNDDGEVVWVNHGEDLADFEVDSGDPDDLDQALREHGYTRVKPWESDGDQLVAEVERLTDDPTP